MLDFKHNSPEDLTLRGFTREHILKCTGVDIGYHGIKLRDKLSGVDRRQYKIQYVKNHFGVSDLKEVLKRYALGLSKEETLNALGVAGVNILTLKALFEELGLSEEFMKADGEHRRSVMRDGMVSKYGTDNPFNLQQFQDKSRRTRVEKYGGEYTLSKGSTLADKAHEKFRKNMRRKTFRKELHKKKLETLNFHGFSSPRSHDVALSADRKGVNNRMFDRVIPHDVDITNVGGGLTAIVKDAQRALFYAEELRLWEENPSRGGSWGTVEAFIYANRCKYLHKSPEELTDREILRAFRVSGLYYGHTSFDNSLMLKVLRKYNVKSVYDPCSGWGERMVTCVLNNVAYEGCDINEQLDAGYRKLADRFGAKNYVQHYNDASLQQVMTFVDAIITCPPYMGKEFYTDKGAENLNEQDFKDWWLKVVEQCSRSMANVFAVQTDQRCRDIFKSCCEKAGWRFAEELHFDTEKISHLNRSERSVKRERETMLVFVRWSYA